MRTAQPKRAFSELHIKNLKPEKKPYLRWDATVPGLVVRVEPSGYKSWKVIYKFGGRRRDYPHRCGGEAIDIKDAREMTGEIMDEVAEGKDPQAEKRSKRSDGTFNDIADRYLEYIKRENKSWKSGRQSG